MRSRSLIELDLNTGPVPRVEDSTYEHVRRTLDDALAELERDVRDDRDDVRN